VRPFTLASGWTARDSRRSGYQRSGRWRQFESRGSPGCAQSRSEDNAGQTLLQGTADLVWASVTFALGVARSRLGDGHCKRHAHSTAAKSSPFSNLKTMSRALLADKGQPADGFQRSLSDVSNHNRHPLVKELSVKSRARLVVVFNWGRRCVPQMTLGSTCEIRRFSSRAPWPPGVSAMRAQGTEAWRMGPSIRVHVRLLVEPGNEPARPYNRPDSGPWSISDSGADAEISPLARGSSDLHSWCVRVFGADGVALLPVRIQSDGAGRCRCGLHRARGLGGRGGRVRALSRVPGQDRQRTGALAAIALWHVRGSVRGRPRRRWVEVIARTHSAMWLR
jgi:hypothetical protein